MTGISTPVNPLLTWETSEQFDIGIDAEFFHNRLAVSLDYFDKKTNNLIQEQTINWPDYIGLTPAAREPRRNQQPWFRIPRQLERPHQPRLVV